ncbi:hypothetical protein TREMEDRAFT_61530 [Tremella mesenterica DSM 1558]|uniref:uncharacterized protein n=1 Tax=Tremella mesenterica (strain ATCC 24925 / CBS 8224 / DSM 1558 / NBRC 9311 / NRRL Y-6157 / RJB 2259-6 / UBC 559-6) TaxID=578456 RepID=UPI0003F4A101|nr:uncharacterized protein TREMEDRAFT_61530 [Tremella mesenterica DSM 1558]EIW69765.1 hypothetical protein TREMEDRAFT_61530 [Tremella mesenterica DSM 1558]
MVIRDTLINYNEYLEDNNHPTMSDIQSMTTAQSLSPSEVTHWLLSQGQTVDLDGKREKFHNYLSQAKAFLEDETLFPTNSPPETELAKIFQSAKSNLIATLDKYASGAADKVFSYDAHGEKDCSAVDDETGCGVGEMFIRELSQNLGNLALSGIPLSNLDQEISRGSTSNILNPTVRHAYGIYTRPKSEKVDHDQSSNPFDSKSGSDSETNTDSEDSDLDLVIANKSFLALLGKAYMTITNTTTAIHTEPSEVLNKDIEILSHQRLGRNHMDTEAVCTAMKTIEGKIDGYRPRDIIKYALSAHRFRSKAHQSDVTLEKRRSLLLEWSRKQEPQLPKLGFVGRDTQVKVVRAAMARIELSTWGVADLTRNSVTRPFDGYDVLSLRRLTEEICEGITTGWRLDAKDKVEE